ncbi:MAG: divergent polysaccharide deacetylase family protein [Gammaproteobacteria bacterium]|nr:divergent polysaccharide deacetylase family protein [Gammaproteobacteria bacterium]MDH5778090.1 divergent polysaccharide deacetylase family protein [Gammaproteobacteria bacterium]
MLRRWLIVCLLLISAHTRAEDSLPSPDIFQPVISIIIDDLGHRYRASKRVVHLPWPVTCSFLPHTRHADSLARQAWLLNKEVMVHMPMEPISGKAMGRGGLSVGMQRLQFEQTLMKSIQAVPFARGLNNHMGSRLTRDAEAMNWLMHSLSQKDNFYFVDSRTTQQSQAMHKANQHGILNASRDIFLDHELTTANIKNQFQRLLKRARRYGSAVAIGHPHPETLAVLEQSLPHLAEIGIKLVPVSELIQIRKQRRLAWQTSSFRWHKAAKNSKP